MAGSLAVGIKAPDFTLPSTTGGMVGPSNYSGQKKLVIAFYPKDETSGCTLELSAFREDYQKFQQLGAEILSISPDSLDSHNSFSDKLGGIPFPMLSDTDGSVIRLYGVQSGQGFTPTRSVFVLDKDGMIIHANTNYDVSNPQHYEEIFQALRK